MTRDPVRIALVLPDLLGTYGDRGNVMVLAQRLKWRGIDSEAVTVLSSAQEVPESCDVYMIGGGEDVAQVAAVNFLRRGGGLQRAVSRGAPVLGICGGLQVLGTGFVTGDGDEHEGLGLVDAWTEPGAGRAIGEVTEHATLGAVGMLTGFENHLGRTVLGEHAQPLGRVTRGTGNGHDGVEGAVSGHVVCTYLHGPVLARNPQLADLLLEWAIGEPLEPLPDPPELRALRTQRTRLHVRERK
ncbi:glutamine amidotransferase [Saccharopolyspora sp. HNM0983]|uniref:Lipid II isoglutaminyl synthase (glutamine-hydrolyzing) subunit GatD n=1 Tax=Saccharopolyspora montiporae TaxID=2781240 RepID=A0A929G1Y5_9PSEU|nr:glutamine amidotransferase [Saccharopolyspora sp. HNM0983]MBE9376327.1 glutamine amidotransferase [Saccharopolyspora sp. HNM0983]